MPRQPQRPKVCLGFGPHEGKCSNPPGPRSPYRCDRCEDLRMAHITKRLDDIIADIKREAREAPHA